MIRAAFLSFYRSLTRHPLYSALNLLGLSFGIAVFIVLSLFVRFETSYEQWLPNANRIYAIAHRLNFVGREKRPFSYTSAIYALEVIRAVQPGLVGTRIIPAYTIARHGTAISEERGQLVDREFFSVFDLPVLAGDRQKALAAPDGLILSERMARKYFGGTDVIGQRLYLREENYFGNAKEEEKAWRVMAILKDVPANSNLKIDMIRAITAYGDVHELPAFWSRWGRGQEARVFVVLPFGESADTLRQVSVSTLEAFHDPGVRYSRATRNIRIEFDLRRFAGEHLSDDRLAAVVYGLAVTAGLVLVVAFINYINLATARMVVRTREMAARSVHGATPAHLAAQLVIEALLAGVLSQIVAFSLVEVGLPVLNRLGNLTLALDYGRDAGTVLALFTGVLFCCALASLVPAALMTGVRPRQLIGGTRSFSGNRPGGVLRSSLSIVQFIVAGIFFILIIGFAAQLRHMQKSDLGFSRDNLLTTDAMIGSRALTTEFENVLRGWRSTPGIDAVTGGQVPGQYFMHPSCTVRSGKTRGGGYVTIAEEWTTGDFFKVYRTPLVTGRPSLASDDIAPQGVQVKDSVVDKKVIANVDLNVSAVKALGFASPEAAVGSDFSSGSADFHIVGVVTDQHFQGPTLTTEPTLYGVDSSKMFQWYTIIRYNGIGEAQARLRLQAVWDRFLPGKPVTFLTMRDQLDYYYRDDRRNTRLFAIGGGVAAFIGAVGLFGMAAFNTSARVHEIGIRKAQGASRGRILRLLMFQFLRPVLIANVIAWPIAYVVLDAWLKQFDDRVAMSPWFFLAGSGLSLLIAAVTVFGVAWSGASLSPAKALRQL